MKYILIIFTMFMVLSCDFMDKESIEIKKMSIYWHNRKINFPSKLPCKVMGKDTLSQDLLSKKYKIFTYIDTMGCTSCNFGAMDWKQIIHEADSLTKNVVFLFYAHLKKYNEFEENLKINHFHYPIFYDYMGDCNKLNNLPNHVFYQTFLLDKDNKVLLLGKPKPGSKLWELYKKIITE